MKVAMAFKAVPIWETAKPLTFFWLRQSISMVMKNKGSRFMAGRIFRKESEKTSDLDQNFLRISCDHFRVRM
jgi:hypothetical protein